jgi:hypothetical protein
MKLGVFAASVLLGVATLVPASFAQGDAQVMQSRSRILAGDDSGTAGRLAPAAPSRSLETARLPAGMMPDQPVGPVRSISGDMSNQPAPGGDIRPALRRQ